MAEGEALGSPAPPFGLEEGLRVKDSINMIAERIPQLKSLSPEEKLILVGEIWKELAAQPDMLPPREDHIKILKERLEQYRQNPSDVLAWEDVKARILGAR
jgi:putative addiction module component (TIGR02574 family)